MSDHQAREQILDTNSYLSRPPKIISLKYRLCLEATSFAIRSIILALRETKAITDSHLEPQPEFSPDELVSLYTKMWAVVDQTHMLRTLLAVNNGDNPKSPVFKFFQAWNVATNIRNKMDHIHQNLQNLAESKQRTATIFGTLSYCRAENTVGETVRATTITIPFGTLTHETHNFPSVNPTDLEFLAPTGLFCFSAFDQIFPIYLLFDEVWECATILEAIVHKLVDRALEGQSDEIRKRNLVQGGPVMIMLDIEAPAPQPPTNKERPENQP